MTKYSEFFQTLHDEQPSTTTFGMGAHYSILRAVVFHDTTGKPLPEAQCADFAVIWDGDHDTRVIEPVERIYLAGLLPHFFMFGERKGSFHALLASETSRARFDALGNLLNGITQHLDIGDSWPAQLLTLEDCAGYIIPDGAEKVDLYLRNLLMLWELGLKRPRLPLRD